MFRLFAKKSTSIPAYSREKILEGISEASNWTTCKELSKTHVLSQMNWLQSKLGLSNISFSEEELDNLVLIQMGTKMGMMRDRDKNESLLSQRQESCLNNCMRLIGEDRPSEAYHELHDFIEDYGRKGKFTSTLEIKGIKFMVDAMCENLQGN